MASDQPAAFFRVGERRMSSLGQQQYWRECSSRPVCCSLCWLDGRESPIQSSREKPRRSRKDRRLHRPRWGRVVAYRARCGRTSSLPLPHPARRHRRQRFRDHNEGPGNRPFSLGVMPEVCVVRRQRQAMRRAHEKEARVSDYALGESAHSR